MPSSRPSALPGPSLGLLPGPWPFLGFPLALPGLPWAFFGSPVLGALFPWAVGLQKPIQELTKPIQQLDKPMQQLKKRIQQQKKLLTAAIISDDGSHARLRHVVQ